MPEQKTQPKTRFPKDYKIDKNKLAAGRYGTLEMSDIWGSDQTTDYGLKVQGQAQLTMHRVNPDIVSEEIANEISSVASIQHVNPERVDELETKYGHDIIGLNKALEEKVSDKAKPHINQAKTSADTTQPARALQIKRSLEVIVDSVENLRDIILEKSMMWIDKPYMDVTHGYDAVPSVAGRPLAHYGEVLQSGLNLIKAAYLNSIMGKWADVTGNHHSAKTLGIDGIRLQEEYCADLGVNSMIAPAQVPALEYEADVAYSISRLGQTIGNIGQFIAWGRNDDVNIFVNASPQRSKGSSGMPHKDAKNGNPTTEEQAVSLRNKLMGWMVTSLINCEMPYARVLYGSADGRIDFEDNFKFTDHVIRELAKRVYWINLNEERSEERVLRSYGVVTSPRIITYLTDSRRVGNPMARSEAHDFLGKMAEEAWKTKTQFADVLLASEEISSRIDEKTLRQLANPLDFIGESKRIVKEVYNAYHGKKTLV